MKHFLFLISLLLSFNISANYIYAEDYLEKGEFQKAFNEFYKVAKLGNIRAQYNLALMLLNGKGIEKSPVMAYAWAKTAGSSVSSTQELTDTIIKSLSKDQLKIAQDLATKYIDLYGVIATKTLIGPITTDLDAELSQSPQFDSQINYNKIIKNSKSNDKLKYPNKAIKKSGRGWVDLTFEIMPNGTVQNIYIFHQFPHELFAPSAIEFAQQQLFDFYMDNKKVVASKSVIASNRFKYGVYGRSGILGRKLKMEINKLFNKASNGDLEAQYNYSNLFYTVLNQQGLASETLVNHWLFRASRFGMPTAQYRLGKNIYFGNSCKQEQQKGLDWLIRSSQGGNTQAQYLTYQILKNNNLINHSDKSAQQWLHIAAENESYISQFIIAKQLVLQESLSESEKILTNKYLENYANFVGKTIDWYQTRALFQVHIKEFIEAKKSIKKALKLAKKAKWNLTELKEQKSIIEKNIS